MVRDEFLKMKYMEKPPNKEEFYHAIALVSMKFAKMEYHLMEILSLFIVDNFVISSILFEKNTLNTNLEILKRISQYNRFEEVKLQSMLKEIDSLRVRRNLFIHGLWSEPTEENNDIKCVVSTYKIKYSKNDHQREWKQGNHTLVTLSQLKSLIQTIDTTIKDQELLLKLMDEHSDDLRDY